jgi:hypothetical protein
MTNPAGFHFDKDFVFARGRYRDFYKIEISTRFVD